MKARIKLAGTALGILGIAMGGLVLLRHPAHRLVGLGTLADGVVTLTTGRGVIPHAWRALSEGRTNPTGNQPATEVT
jgi:hypothetical protein